MEMREKIERERERESVCVCVSEPEMEKEKANWARERREVRKEEGVGGVVVPVVVA